MQLSSTSSVYHMRQNCEAFIPHQSPSSSKAQHCKEPHYIAALVPSDSVHNVQAHLPNTACSVEHLQLSFKLPKELIHELQVNFML